MTSTFGTGCKTSLRRAFTLILFIATMMAAFVPASQAQAQGVDWLINISAAPDPIPAGGTIDYSIAIINSEPDLAPPTIFEFTVPPGTTLTGTTPGAPLAVGNCRVVPPGAVAPFPAGTPLPAIAGDRVVCDVPELPQDTPATFTAQLLTSAANVADAVLLTVLVRDDDGVDGSTSNNTEVVEVTVNSGADLAIELNLPAQAAAGSTIPFSITVENLGPNDSEGYTVEFPVPPGLEIADLAPGCLQSGGLITCVVTADLLDGETATFNFTGQITVGSGSNIAATTSVASTTPDDPIADNNGDNQNILVTPGVDLFVDITRDTGPNVLTGDAVVFTLSPGYTGDNPEDITVTHVLPPNFELDPLNPIVASGWTVVQNGNELTFTRASGTGPGADVDLGDIVIPTIAIAPGTAVSEVTIASTSGPAEQNTNNNTAAITSTITDPVVDLAAFKTGPSPALGVVGNPYTFSLTARNLGNAPFVGELFVRDVLPAGLELTAFSGSGWVCDTVPPGLPLPDASGVTIECLRTYTAASPLAAGAAAPVVTVTAIPRATGVLTNTMVVGSTDPTFVEPNTGNNTVTFDIGVNAPDASADISVNKSVAEPTLAAGEVQTYTLEMVNLSTDGTPSLNVTLTDRFLNLANNRNGGVDPAYLGEVIVAGPNVDGLTCSSVTSGGRGRLLTCTAVELRPCTAGVDCPIITVQVRHGTDLTTIPNTANIISATTPDPDVSSASNSSSTSFTQTRVMDLTIAKTVSATETLAGQNVSFTLSAEVVPTGLSNARDVVLTDTLPDGMRFVSVTPGAPPSPGDPSWVCTTTLTEGDLVVAGVNDLLTCTIAQINNGQQRTVTVVLQPVNDQIGDNLTNLGTIASTSTPENDVEPNTDTATTTVLAPRVDLAVSKSDDEDPLVVGETTTYTINVRNDGPSNSEQIVVTDTLPPEHLGFQSVTIDGPGTCRLPLPATGSTGGTLICDFPFLAAGDSFDIEVVAIGLSKGDSINMVEISSFEILNNFDFRPGNNSTSERTTVRTRTDIQLVSKTPSLATVALEDNFTYEIVGRVNSGPGLAEADNVVVTDLLPPNMVLTGTPTTTFPGGTCTGMAGDTGVLIPGVTTPTLTIPDGTFRCDLGTVNAGETFSIIVPVEVIAVTSEPQTFVNSATVTTTSRDESVGNDTVTGPVDVVSSSLAGTIFRDFANNGVFDGTDTLITGVPVTLTGLSEDGRTITRTTTTDINGYYLFEFLPAGTYTVTRGTPAEPLLSDGIDTPGSEGGAAVGPDTINAITLPDDTDAIDYDFAFIPQATIGLAKELAGQVTNADGSFTATFDLVVENLSLERLINISVTDPLAGGEPLFGTLATPANPATDTLAFGTYAIVATSTGSCGGANAAFNGAGDTVLASGFALDIGASCTISFTIRVQPTDPLPTVQAPSGGQYENQASVTGVGEASGQTPSDVSDDGTNPDPDGDRNPDEAGENDPTPVIVGSTPSIEVVKVADTSALSNPPLETEEIAYSFTVTNTGNVNLTNVTLTDALPGIELVGGPIPLLAPGQSDTTTFTATYALQQPDLDLGSLVNTATVTGTPPVGDPVTDDDVVTTPLAQDPSIELVKTADTSALSDPPQVGEVITYAFAVTNTGNVSLTNVTIADALPGVVVTGGPAVIEPGDTDTTTFTATYALVPADLTAGEVINTATVSGTPPVGDPVTDDSTVTNPLAQVPGIELVKSITDETSLDDGADVGDIISYAFTVTNTGNVPLFNVVVTDALPGVVQAGGPIPVMNPAAAADGTDVDSTTFTATYALTAADVANFGVVTNTATATGFYGPGNLLSVSDDSSVTATPPDPSDGLVLTKTTPDETVRRGALVPYTIRLLNNNSFPAVNQTIVDTLPAGLVFVEDSAQVDGVDTVPNVVGQVISFPGINLAPGQEVVVTLLARILNGTNPGVYVNEAIVLDPVFGLVAGPARATVRVLPEPIFDCGDVIGRVFDDLDGDGYQDAYEADEIPDDPVEDHKIEDIVRELTDEVGLPGVRIVTLDGLVITTDENGLFSVPCAALPADRGSNFLLSLDERTLPLGYAMTTQNPRVMRLTPGMMTEMNFGARLSQMMRVDLNAQAFDHGGGLTLELQHGIAAMVERLADDRTRVELVYHVPAHAGADMVAAGRGSMAVVQAEIARQWSDVGRGRLNITQTIARGGN